MTSESLEDDVVGPRADAQGPDAHGQAAILLVESLIHGLIARSVISVTDAVEILDIATEVKVDIGADLAGSDSTTGKSLRLLRAISSSLKLDLPPRVNRELSRKR